MRALILVNLVGLAVGSEWSQYLDSMKGKNYEDFDWMAACKSLGQTPAGYGMSMAGGVTTFSLTCNSNHIKVECEMDGVDMKSCSSKYKPIETAGTAAMPDGYSKDAKASNCNGMKLKEAQEILDYHNKMRCATGAEPVEWDEDLACQAQKSQDDIGKFKHSKSYDLPISAGENLATGIDVANAAWMWFLEYMNTDTYEGHGHQTGHFTAMAWRSVKKIGCGIQKTDDGVIRCQYSSGSGTAPNMQGEYDKEIPAFHGKASQLKKCGLPLKDLVGQAKMQIKWGILHPTGVMKSNVDLYSSEQTVLSVSSSVTAPMAVAMAAASGIAILSMIGMVRRRRRNAASFEALVGEQGSYQ